MSLYVHMTEYVGVCACAYWVRVHTQGLQRNRRLCEVLLASPISGVITQTEKEK